MVSATTVRTLGSGRALLREIRTSFYRRLFLTFVAAALVPVVILAIAIRTYALKNVGRHAKDGYDFCSTTHCQRFVRSPRLSKGVVSNLSLRIAPAGNCVTEKTAAMI